MHFFYYWKIFVYCFLSFVHFQIIFYSYLHFIHLTSFSVCSILLLAQQRSNFFLRNKTFFVYYKHMDFILLYFCGQFGWKRSYRILQFYPCLSNRLFLADSNFQGLRCYSSFRLPFSTVPLCQFSGSCLRQLRHTLCLLT